MAEHPEKARSSPSASPKIWRAGSACCSTSGSAISRSNAARRRSRPGELQRLRLATQVRSNLFGVVYVLDEPSAGLHPADTEALLRALDRFKASGNSLFVVEHELDVIRHADWIVDVGPAAGEQGGRMLYSGRPPGCEESSNRKPGTICFAEQDFTPRSAARPQGWLRLTGVTRNNLAPTRRRISARGVYDGHRRLRLGQIEPGEPGAGRTRGSASWA